MKPNLGQKVVFCDPKGNDHDALVTAVWSETCINVVFVSTDSAKQDDYGRQIERNTSVSHVNTHGVAHGMYWRFDDEPKKEYKPPIAV